MKCSFCKGWRNPKGSKWTKDHQGRWIHWSCQQIVKNPVAKSLYTLFSDLNSDAQATYIRRLLELASR